MKGARFHRKSGPKFVREWLLRLLGSALAKFSLPPNFPLSTRNTRFIEASQLSNKSSITSRQPHPRLQTQTNGKRSVSQYCSERRDGQVSTLSMYAMVNSCTDVDDRTTGDPVSQVSSITLDDIRELRRVRDTIPSGLWLVAMITFFERATFWGCKYHHDASCP